MKIYSVAALLMISSLGANWGADAKQGCRIQGDPGLMYLRFLNLSSTLTGETTSHGEPIRIMNEMTEAEKYEVRDCLHKAAELGGCEASTALELFYSHSDIGANFGITANPKRAELYKSNRLQYCEST